MVVGVATLTLNVPYATSLKDRRRVVKSIVDRVRPRFNVAIAEIGEQETWGTVELAIACISTDAAHAHAMLQKAVKAVDNGRFDADLMDYRIEML